MNTGPENFSPDQRALIDSVCRERKYSALSFKSRDAAERFCQQTIEFFFPQLAGETDNSKAAVEADLTALRHCLELALEPFCGLAGLSCDAVCNQFFAKASGTVKALSLDARAIFENDPAAESVDEVILAYPGFLATAVYRISRIFFLAGVPVFPRLLTEYGHRQTGVDVHPGAEIGSSFSIDHGTGIVIGETAVVGKRVRLFQGVTLGALSVSKELAKSKRHPTIGDDVVIYSHATILGGETVIGDGSVIGGNVFLTASVPPYSVVSRSGKVETRRIAGDGPIDFSI